MHLIEARGVRKTYGSVVAMDGVDLDISAGEVVAIVGRSGSGKSALARCLANMETPNSGTISRRCAARQIQLLWQHPGLSFNPRFTVRNVVEEPSRIAQRASPDVGTLLARAGIPPDCAARRVDQLSGGQKARLALVRALAADARVLILDETLSSLDEETRWRMVDLVRDMTLILITHDLGLAADAARRIVVMDAGRIVETGSPQELLTAPREAPTRLLVEAIPRGCV